MLPFRCMHELAHHTNKENYIWFDTWQINQLFHKSLISPLIDTLLPLSTRLILWFGSIGTSVGLQPSIPTSFNKLSVYFLCVTTILVVEHPTSIPKKYLRKLKSFILNSLVSSFFRWNFKHIIPLSKLSHQYIILKWLLHLPWKIWKTCCDLANFIDTLSP